MTASREPLREALRHPNVRAFLRLIRQGESSQGDEAYRMLFGGEIWDGSLEEHPRKVFPFGSQHTDAFGAYQFMARVEGYGFPDTYDRLSRVLGPSMEPEEQDLKAVQLIAWRKALDDVIAGRLNAALEKCSWEWASLPVPSTGKWRYKGQSGLTMADALLVYKAWGGALEEARPDFNPDSLATEHYGDTTMAPIILPLLQVAAQFIPQLVEKFGSGSEVANRNIAAGKVLADAITAATQSPNLQAAIQKMEEDPGAVRSAKEAVAVHWAELFEVGGGVETARKSAGDPGQVDWWRNPAVIVAILVLPLVYMVVIAVVFGIGGQAWSDDVKTLTVTAILSGALGSITGFFLGSSLGSQRKTSMLGKE